EGGARPRRREEAPRQARVDPRAHGTARDRSRDGGGEAARLVPDCFRAHGDDVQGARGFGGRRVPGRVSGGAPVAAPEGRPYSSGVSLGGELVSTGVRKREMRAGVPAHL